MCLFRLFFYEKYDYSNHSMIKCNFKKVNNWAATTYALMGAFGYTTNGVTMPAHSLSGELDYFGRNEISSGGDLSHYSSVSLY